MTKEAHSTDELKIKGEGLAFYSPEEVEIAYAEGQVSLNAKVRCRLPIKEDGVITTKLTETTVGRILFNQIVPKESGYINELLTKKSLRNVIGRVLADTDFPTTVKFLDDMKNLGYSNAFKGGLSFSLGDIVIPAEKKTMIAQAVESVDEIKANYNMGLITDTERYNQVIDVWTNTNAGLTEMIMSRMKTDQGGFNSVYMMLDSGARGSKEQIRQLSGMRGLMAKPQKAGSTGAEIIENPIVANFKEGLSILEYFISTHGARKGLADTALKTADAGYLTRRLVDVAQDVIITENDCGTLRGTEITPLKKNDEIVERLSERILGRVSLHNVYDPDTDEVIANADELINEALAKKIEAAGIEAVEVRSPLTCETKKGICAKCYGRNLATGKPIHMGEAVGVIAAQSIGEPGTQLTLRTFHQGGTAGNISENPSIVARRDGIVEMDEVRTVTSENDEGKKAEILVSRSTEFRLVADNAARTPLMIANVPYGSELLVKPGDKVKKGDVIAKWDPYNAVIIAESAGKVEYEDIIQGISFQLEIDEQTGFEEKVISESRNKKAVPTLKVVDSKGVEQKAYNLPVGAHLMVRKLGRVKS